VLLSAAMLLLWLFPADVMRRLMYPLVPLVLLHAAETVQAVADRMGIGSHRSRILAVAAALPALLCLPALVLVHSKAADREPVFEGSQYSRAAITEYYTTIAVRPAREAAARHAAVLTGLERLKTATPPGARVMWMRPDYVALLGDREGVPWYYRDGLAGLARRLQDTGTEYLVAATLYKTDMKGEQLDFFATAGAFAAFAQPVLAIRNPEAPIEEFVLMKVDAEALRSFLAAPR
jgi:hypothetical protein